MPQLLSRLGQSAQAAVQATAKAAAAAPEEAAGRLEGMARYGSSGGLNALAKPSDQHPLSSRQRSARHQQQQQHSGVMVQAAAGEQAASSSAVPASPTAALPPGVALTPRQCAAPEQDGAQANEEEQPQQQQQPTPSLEATAGGTAAGLAQPAAAQDEEALPAPQELIAGEDPAAAKGLISWRSDAVQLPEITLADALASPRSPQDTPTATAAAAAAAVAATATAPAAVPAAAVASAAGAIAGVAVSVAGAGVAGAAAAADDGAAPLRSARAALRGGGTDPALAAIAEEEDASEGQKQEPEQQQQLPQRTPPWPVLAQPAVAAESSSTFSEGSTPSPTAVAANALALALGMAAGSDQQRSGLPLPDGVPRINMRGWPVTLPPTVSGNWASYADSISDSFSGTAVAHGPVQASTTPQSVRSKTPAAEVALVAAAGPPADAVQQVPESIGPDEGLDAPTASAAATVAAAAEPAAEGPGASGRLRSMPATKLEMLAAEAALTPDAEAAAAAEAAGAAPPGSRRLGSMSAPATWRGGQQPFMPDGTRSSSPQQEPTSPRLLRSTSEPAAAGAEAAAVLAAAAGSAGVASGPSLRREPSAVDFSSPDTAALAGRVSRSLSRAPDDRLVQDLMRLARYRILGQGRSAGLGPRARTMPRTATAVLASRHVRQGDGVARTSLGTLSDEEGGMLGGMSGPASLTPQSPGGGAAAAAADAAASSAELPRLGFAMPAVAVSRQEPRSSDDVVLYFALIDYLQVGG